MKAKKNAKIYMANFRNLITQTRLCQCEHNIRL